MIYGRVRGKRIGRITGRRGLIVLLLVVVIV